VIIISLLISATYADSITQTSWSGGGGQPGPVLDPYDRFLDSDSISWNGISGQLSLSWIPEEYAWTQTIDNGLDYIHSLCKADLNLDGFPDIIAAGGTNYNEITCWINPCSLTGVWERSTITVFSDEEEVRDVVPVDIDGDSILDIAVTTDTFTGGILRWFSNEGDSADFLSEHIIAVLPHDPSQMTVGDLDGDGYPDIAVVLDHTIYPNELYWFENPGDEHSEWISHGNWPLLGFQKSVCSADIDGDGDIDLVGAWEYPVNDLAWLENDGDGGTWTFHRIGYPYGEIDAVASDIDGDGWTDVVSASRYFHSIKWNRNANGLGTSWVTESISEAEGNSEVLSADLDCDGDQDLASSFAWYESIDTSINQWERHGYYKNDYPNYEITGADIDLDGNTNLIYADDESIRMAVLVWFRRDSGNLTSSIIYTGCDPQWGFIDWDSEEPVGTSLSFQVRSSDDPLMMGDWSNALSSPGSLAGILSDNDSYLQYRVKLETLSDLSTPVLHEVSITWDPVEIAGSEESAGDFILGDVFPNPAKGRVLVDFGVPVQSRVDMAVYDISGRIVWGSTSNVFAPGTHQISVDALEPGVYCLRMNAGPYSGISRFAVVR